MLKFFSSIEYPFFKTFYFILEYSQYSIHLLMFFTDFFQEFDDSFKRNFGCVFLLLLFFVFFFFWEIPGHFFLWHLWLSLLLLCFSWELIIWLITHFLITLCRVVVCHFLHNCTQEFTFTEWLKNRTHINHGWVLFCLSDTYRDSSHISTILSISISIRKAKHVESVMMGTSTVT